MLDSLGTTVIPRTIMHSGGRGLGYGGGPGAGGAVNKANYG